MVEVSRNHSVTKEQEVRRQHAAIHQGLKLKHFPTLSYAVTEGIEGLINAPSGYQEIVGEQFDELRVSRIALQNRLDALSDLQDAITRNENAPSLATPSRRYKAIVRWGHCARDLLSEVEGYLEDLYTGIKEVHCLEKDFNTSANTDASFVVAEGADTVDGGTDDAPLDPEILGRIDRKRGMARSFSYAELTTLKQLATCISDKIDCYSVARPFNPIEVVANTAFTFFYQDVTLAETDYYVNGSRLALRDFLLMSQGIFNAMIVIADQQRLLEKNRILFSHAQSADVVRTEIANAKTDAALKVDEKWIALSISNIPQQTFDNEQFVEASFLLQGLSEQFTSLGALSPELVVNKLGGCIDLKIPVMKAQVSEDVRPESIERLSALEPPQPFLEPEVEIPWRKGNITIKCRTKTHIFCDPFGREVLSYAMNAIMDLFECSELLPTTSELFFDRRKGTGREVDLLKTGAYGICVSSGHGCGVEYSSYQCPRTELCEPIFIPDGAKVEIAPGTFQDDKLKGALAGLLATVTRVHVSALTSNNFILDNDAHRDALTSTIIATTKVVDRLKTRGEDRQRGDLQDPIVLIKPIDILDPASSLYTVQIFGSDGRELHRFRRCNDESAIRSIRVDRRLWREAFTTADRVVRDLIKGCAVDEPEHVLRAFNKSGLGACMAFVDELARHIREGDPLGYLASTFLDPNWMVKKDPHAEKARGLPLCIAIGWRGDQASYLFDGMKLR